MTVCYESVNKNGNFGVVVSFSPLSHLELCWSVRTAFLVVRLRKMAASVPMKSMYMPENSSWSEDNKRDTVSHICHMTHNPR